MNRLKFNKHLKVFGVTFAAAILYFLGIWYLNYLGPYPEYYNLVSFIYVLLGLAFLSIALYSMAYSLVYLLGQPLGTLFAPKIKKEALPLKAAIGPGFFIAFLAIYFMSPYLPQLLPTGSYLLKFNTEVWKQHGSTIMNKGISAREKMLGDLAENILPGKSREEIIHPLGPSRYPNNALRDHYRDYYLGRARGDFSGLSDEYLTVYFDTTGRYDRYDFYTQD